MTVAASKGFVTLENSGNHREELHQLTIGQFGSQSPSRECLLFEFMVTLV